MGDPAAALPTLQRAINLDPEDARSHLNLGIAQERLGAAAESRASFSRAASLNTNLYEAWLGAGNAALALGDPAAALVDFDHAVRLRGPRGEVMAARGRALLRMCRPREALDSNRVAVQASPDWGAAKLGLAEALTGIGRVEEALQILGPLEGDSVMGPDALAARAQAWLRCGRFLEARADAIRVLSMAPTHAAAHFHLGLAQLATGEAADALRSFDQACELQAVFGAAHAWRGFALRDLGRYGEALEAHGRAIAVGWLDPQALVELGGLLVQLNRLDNAHAAFSTAAQLRPDDWRACEGIAMTLVGLRRFDAAVAAFESLLAMGAPTRYLQGHLFHARLQCCDWRDYEEVAAGIVRSVRRGELVDAPWSFLIHNADPADQRLCASAYAAAEYTTRMPVRRRSPASSRIRVAYLSADFHEHATSHLAAGLFERHDRTLFETTAISYGPPDQSGMRRRLERAFERFVDVADRADEAIAGLMSDLGVDIAIDMKGPTTGGRPGILAFRTAPLQVAFLAFPGTMGARFIDYVVADRTVIPPDQDIHYTEKVIRLPDSYQVNDAGRPELAPPRREEVGLPASAFVFCCFNACCKITPEVFRAWMRVLGGRDSSVLWLLESSAAAVRNLRTEAARRGIDPARLIFAPPIAPTQHWARLGLADLFLDTLPYNAHTTASDALWAGVPLVTVAGTSFAGRVATSLLRACGMPELSVASLPEYEQLALRLARSPAELGEYRRRAASARRAAPLFDTQRYCDHFEAALLEIHRRRLCGEAPRPLEVEELTSVGSRRGQGDSQR
jgi:predicted O-linked N-acetylglucosamine transferase (SPINDLY family)